MKSFRIIFSLLIGFLMLNACDTVKDCPENPLDNGNQVKFQATIGALNTRASGTSWDTGDAIGVYALNSGQPMATGIYDGKENTKYTTTGNGIFTAASTGITFPESGSLDFVAYYPYQTVINNNTYNINVATQTNSAAIDLLYSNNCSGKTKDDADISLTFKHMLSMLVLNVSAGDKVANLNGLTVSVSGLKTDGTFNLANGTVTIGATTTALTPSGTVSGTNGTLAAILVPGQSLNAAKVTFTLNGQVFEWVPEDITLESGKKYSYTLQLSTTGIAMLQPTATIVDWEDANTGTGTIVLTPEEGDVFSVDKTASNIAASGTLTDVLQLTTQDTQAWTVASNETWLTVTPSSGTGSGQITLTAQENTGVSRTATVTITPNAPTSFNSVTVTVTQNAGTITPTSDLLFPGSDFEDWETTFKGALNSFGLSKNGYASQSKNGGQNGSSALYLNGTPTANDYTFTALVPAGFSTAGKTKIVFYIKGTSAKSLSLNVYVGAGTTMGTDYKCFNLGNYNTEGTIDYTNSNNYTGLIDTDGNWMKVTLNLADLVINSTEGQNLFALKVGSGVAYDLLVDDITIE